VVIRATTLWVRLSFRLFVLHTKEKGEKEGRGKKKEKGKRKRKKIDPASARVQPNDAGVVTSHWCGGGGGEEEKKKKRKKGTKGGHCLIRLHCPVRTAL